MKYEINITMGDRFIGIESETNREPAIRMDGTIEANEHAAIAAITEILRCLSWGKGIDSHFNPTEVHSDDYTILKCKWERSGKLKILDVSNKKFLHAETVEEAKSRSRTFTCYKNLFRQLPDKR